MRVLVNVVVASELPMALLWGRELRVLCNDAFRELAAEHSRPDARTPGVALPELWPLDGPLRAALMERGEPVLLADEPFPAGRRGEREDAGREEPRFTVSYSPVRGDDGAVAGVLLTLVETTSCGPHRQDVRAQQRARTGMAADRESEELRQSVERFRSVLESMSEGVMLFDRDGNLTYQNPASLRIHGFAPQGDGRIEHDRLPVTWEAWNEEGQPITFDEWPVSRVFRRERFQNQVLHVRRVETGQEFDGSYNGSPIFDSAGRLVQGFITIRDITQQRRAQEALRDTERRFRQLADAMPQVVWTARPDGSVDYYNERVRELQGAHRNEDGTWSWEAVLHPDDVQPTVDAWARAVREGEQYDIAHRVKRADGSSHWYLSRGVPVRDAAGRIVKWFGTATDIHAQKEAEERLRDADRNKNEFLAVLSHELRNPLAPIRSSVYIMDRVPPGGEQARRARAVIDRQVTHLARLIDDLLDVTRISRGKIRLQRESLPLNDVVRNTVEDFRELFEDNGVALEAHVPGEPLRANVDRTRIAQIVGNLLSNAAKFTPAGGRVVVSLEEGEAGGAILRVRDDGAGIAETVLARLFQPFVQADATLDRSKGGLGLGLALVKGLVELHGGEVSAHSDGLGHGAEFQVRVPLDEERAGAARRAEEPRRSGRRTPLRVLLIEDNGDAAETLKEALELNGHRVETAATGIEGIDKARVFRPDVVLCDIGLPGIDGFEVARRMRADPALRDAPLIALSGYAGPEDLERSREAGFVQHLAKPTDLAALETTLWRVSDTG